MRRNVLGNSAIRFYVICEKEKTKKVTDYVVNKLKRDNECVDDIYSKNGVFFVHISSSFDTSSPKWYDITKNGYFNKIIENILKRDSTASVSMYVSKYNSRTYDKNYAYRYTLCNGIIKEEKIKARKIKRKTYKEWSDNILKRIEEMGLEKYLNQEMKDPPDIDDLDNYVIFVEPKPVKIKEDYEQLTLF